MVWVGFETGERSSKQKLQVTTDYDSIIVRELLFFLFFFLVGGGGGGGEGGMFPTDFSFQSQVLR